MKEPDYFVVPFKAYYSFPSVCKNNSDQYDDFQGQFQKCHKDCHQKWKLSLDDYFTASKKFCCLVFDILSCETSILSQCDDEYAKKNQLEIEYVFFKSCITWKEKCGEKKEGTGGTGGTGIAIIVVSLVVVGLLCCYFRMEQITKLFGQINLKVQKYKTSVIVKPDKKDLHPIIQPPQDPINVPAEINGVKIAKQNFQIDNNLVPSASISTPPSTHSYNFDSSDYDAVKNLMKNHLKYDASAESTSLVTKYTEKDWKQFYEDHKKSLIDYLSSKKTAAETYNEIKKTERLLLEGSKSSRWPKLISQQRPLFRFESIPKSVEEVEQENDDKVHWFILNNLHQRGENNALIQWLNEEKTRNKFHKRHRGTLQKYLKGLLSENEAWDQIASKEYQQLSKSNKPSGNFLHIKKPGLTEFFDSQDSMQHTSQTFKDYLDQNDPRLTKLKFEIAEQLRNDNERIAHSTWIKLEDRQLKEFFENHQSSIKKYLDDGKTIEEVWLEIKCKELEYWDKSMKGEDELKRPLLKLSQMHPSSMKYWDGDPLMD